MKIDYQAAPDDEIGMLIVQYNKWSTNWLRVQSWRNRT